MSDIEAIAIHLLYLRHPDNEADAAELWTLAVARGHAEQVAAEMTRVVLSKLAHRNLPKFQ